DINRFRADFITALLAEIGHSKSDLRFDTIFFGGGTPSLLSATELGSLIDRLNRQFKIDTTSEITVETNPGTVDSAKLKEFREAGINRISFGVQSFHTDELQFMERIHSPEQAISAVIDAEKAGFTNSSIDLIFAVPNQNRKKWEANLRQVAQLPIQHISAYSLIIEENTPFANHLKNGVFTAADQETERELYELTIDKLAAMGFEQYEISNFAKSEPFRSQHNLKYWRMAPYLGFGPSAHSYNGLDKRWWNVRSTQKYIEMINESGSARIKEEKLDHDQQILETLMQSFRLREGLNIALFNERFQLDFRDHFAKSIERYQGLGLLDISNEHCYLSKEGQFYCNEILRNF
ncbi:MAG: radical SAM family heme chaperone HemW, partial [Calditrichaeota bacterium]|nr:radical SAM family heme chaperone HemW [Calditrichota bacterium]